MPDTSSNQREKYKILFCGELQSGQDLYSVKSRLSSLLKVPLPVVEKMFLGKPVLVRTGLTLEVAQSFKSGIEKTGILCRLLGVSEKTEMPTAAPAATSPGSPPAAYEPSSFRPPPAAHSQDRGSGKIIAMFIGIIFLAIVAFNMISRKADINKPELLRTKTAVRNPSPDSPPLPRSTPAAGLLSDNLEDFDDPKQYYSLSLPEGYRVTDKSSGSRSKVLFSYPDGSNVTIIASPMPRKWEPQSTMDQKVRAIREGRAGELSRFEITHYQLVNLSGMEGYEIILKKGSDIAHAYALVTPEDIAFSISMVTSGDNNRQNHDILDSAIRSSLRFY